LTKRVTTIKVMVGHVATGRTAGRSKWESSETAGGRR
jgi:hypothetical protein